jgi:hypothetical protein
VSVKGPDPINDNARHNSELFLPTDLVLQVSGHSNLQQLRGAASLRKILIVLISRSVLCAKSGVIPGHYERYKMSI